MCPCKEQVVNYFNKKGTGVLNDDRCVPVISTTKPIQLCAEFLLKEGGHFMGI